MFSASSDQRLSAIYLTHGSWANIEVFDSLAAAVRDHYQEVGLTFSDTENGTYVDIPHRADTLPTLAEFLEFQQQQIRKQIADVMNSSQTAKTAGSFRSTEKCYETSNTQVAEAVY